MIDETLTGTTPSAESSFPAGQVAISVRYESGNADLPPIILEKKPSTTIPAGISEWAAVAALQHEDVILNVVDEAALYRFRAARNFDGRIQVIAS